MIGLNGSTFASGLARKSLEGLLSVWERIFQANLTYHARPRNAGDMGIWSAPRPDLPPLGLVLQGPVLRSNNFTLESVKLYKRTFPGTTIVLSTWKSEPPSVLEPFKQLGVEVLANDPPANPGQQNFNYQLISSSAGIARAAEMGAQYVMKTRTDQRVCGVNLQPLLMNLLETFPLRTPSVQKRRLIVPGIGTLKSRLYGVSDMLQFGHIDDMRLYWGAAQTDNRVLPNEKLTRRQFAMRRVCEVYLATEFLKAIGHKLDWTLRDSWQSFGDYFCIVDSSALDLYWPKYDRFREYRRLIYSQRSVDEPVTFLEWMTYYTGEVFRHEIPEWILDAESSVLEPPKR